MACSEGAFIGQEAGGGDVLKVAGAGWPGDVQRQRQVRRPWGRAGGERSWRRGSVGTHGRAHVGRHRAERQRERRGGPGGFLPFLPCLMARVGAGEAGARQRGSPRYGYRARAYGDDVGHNKVDFPGFRPPSVRSNARMNFEFEILKSASVGYQDTS
jgi:hypothetical protein